MGSIITKPQVSSNPPSVSPTATPQPSAPPSKRNSLSAATPVSPSAAGARRAGQRISGSRFVSCASRENFFYEQEGRLYIQSSVPSPAPAATGSAQPPQPSLGKKQVQHQQQAPPSLPSTLGRQLSVSRNAEMRGSATVIFAAHRRSRCPPKPERCADSFEYSSTSSSDGMDGDDDAILPTLSATTFVPSPRLGPARQPTSATVEPVDSLDTGFWPPPAAELVRPTRRALTVATEDATERVPPPLLPLGTTGLATHGAAPANNVGLDAHHSPSTSFSPTGGGVPPSPSHAITASRLRALRRGSSNASSVSAASEQQHQQQFRILSPNGSSKSLTTLQQSQQQQQQRWGSGSSGVAWGSASAAAVAAVAATSNPQQQQQQLLATSQSMATDPSGASGSFGAPLGIWSASPTGSMKLAAAGGIGPSNLFIGSTNTATNTTSNGSRRSSRDVVMTPHQLFAGHHHFGLRCDPSTSGCFSDDESVLLSPLASNGPLAMHELEMQQRMQLLRQREADLS